MPDQREYKGVNDLIKILEKRGLHIDRGSQTLSIEKILSTVGYHRLSAYFDTFYDDADRKTFREDASLDLIIQTYYLDRRLRQLILGPLDKIEVAVRSAIIKEVGDFLIERGDSQPIINFDDKSLYDMGSQLKALEKKNDEEEKKKRHLVSVRKHIKKSEVEIIRFRGDIESGIGHSRDIDAWEAIQHISIGALSKMYSIFQQDIQENISAHFGVSALVLGSALNSLTDLRNRCAHHDRIWNISHKPFRFPNRYTVDARINENENTKYSNRIYKHCAIIHIFLSSLSGESLWYRRLKKLLNEFDHFDTSAAMGFPENWQTMPFWRVKNVKEINAWKARQRCILPQ